MDKLFSATAAPANRCAAFVLPMLCACWLGSAQAITAGSSLQLPSLTPGSVITASGYDPSTSSPGHYFSNSSGTLQGDLQGVFAAAPYQLDGSVFYNLAASTPIVTATVSAFDGIPNFSDCCSLVTRATGELSYTFSLPGPVDFSVSVPIWISGSVSMSKDAVALSGEFDVTTLTLPTGAVHTWNSASTSFASYAYEVFLHPGIAYPVDIYASASITGMLPGTLTTTASIDPYISIDPTYADAGKYQVVVEAGINNIAPVPEPAGIWLLGAGLGVILIQGRRAAI